MFEKYYGWNCTAIGQGFRKSSQKIVFLNCVEVAPDHPIETCQNNRAANEVHESENSSSSVNMITES